MQCSALREEMLDVLYGEADAATRRRVEEHQIHCAACRQEMASLQRLREDLQEWTLPPSIAASRPASPVAVVRPATWWRRGLAAAAVLTLALGGALGLSGSEIRYEGGQWAVRLGRAQQAADVQRLLAEEHARHLKDVAELQQAVADLNERQTAQLTQVKQMLRTSEEAQFKLLGAGLKAVDSQLQRDRVRTATALSYLDNESSERATAANQAIKIVASSLQVK
jgi:hypothetical protein